MMLSVYTIIGKGAGILMVGVLLATPLSVVFADHNVNINTASKSELETLTGIGPAKAQAIIDYRDANGLFQSIEEIKDVNGIGDVTFEENRGHITVGSNDNPSGNSGSEEDNASEDDGGTQSHSNEEKPENSNKASSGGGDGGGEMTYPLGGEELTVTASVNKTHASVNTPIVFTGEAYYGDRVSSTAQRIWNFGNGDTAYGKEVEYVFEHTGTYAVTFHAKTFEEEAHTTLTVNVVAPGITITQIHEHKNGFIEIQNSSDRRYELSGWRVVSGSDTFLMPPYTFIEPDTTLRLSAQTLGFIPRKHNTRLTYPDGSVASILVDDPPARSDAPSRRSVPPRQSVSDSPTSVSDSQENKEGIMDSEANTATVAQYDDDSEIPTDSDTIFLWVIALGGVISLAGGAVVLMRHAQKDSKEGAYDHEEYTYSE